MDEAIDAGDSKAVEVLDAQDIGGNQPNDQFVPRHGELTYKGGNNE